MRPTGACAVAGFPNLFLLIGPNVGVGPHVDGLHDRVAAGLRARRAAHHGREGLAVLETTPQAPGGLTGRRPSPAGGAPSGSPAAAAAGTSTAHGHNPRCGPDFTFRFRQLTRRLDRENLRGDAGRRPDGGGRVTARREADGRRRGRGRRPAAHDRSRAVPRRRSTLVLAHGWTLSQAAWDDVAAELAARRSPPGSCGWSGTTSAATAGRPGAPPSRCRSTCWARTSARVLDQARRPDRCVLGGHSMGGMTIMCLAAAQPDLFGGRVQGVALVDTSAGDLRRPPRTPGRAAAAALEPGVITSRWPGPGWSNGCARLSPPVRPVAPARSSAGCCTAPTRPARWCCAAPRSCTRPRCGPSPSSTGALGQHDKHAELAALTRVPVEVLVGEEDKLTPGGAQPAAGRRAARRRPARGAPLRAHAAAGAPGHGGVVPAPAPGGRGAGRARGDGVTSVRRSADDRRAQLVEIGLELLPTTPVQELTIDEVARRGGDQPEPAVPLLRVQARVLHRGHPGGRRAAARPRRPARGDAAGRAAARDARPLRDLGGDLPGQLRGVRPRRARRRPVGRRGLRGHPARSWWRSRWPPCRCPTGPGSGSWCARGSPSPRTSCCSGPGTRR